MSSPRSASPRCRPRGVNGISGAGPYSGGGDGGLRAVVRDDDDLQFGGRPDGRSTAARRGAPHPRAGGGQRRRRDRGSRPPHALCRQADLPGLSPGRPGNHDGGRVACDLRPHRGHAAPGDAATSSSPSTWSRRRRQSSTVSPCCERGSSPAVDAGAQGRASGSPGAFAGRTGRACNMPAWFRPPCTAPCSPGCCCRSAMPFLFVSHLIRKPRSNW